MADEDSRLKPSDMYCEQNGSSNCRLDDKEVSQLPGHGGSLSDGRSHRFYSPPPQLAISFYELLRKVKSAFSPKPVYQCQPYLQRGRASAAAEGYLGCIHWVGPSL